MGSVERELSNEDCGSDLQSVSRLLKALRGLEHQVDGLRDRIQVQRPAVISQTCLLSKCSTQVCLLLKKCFQVLMDTAKSLHSQGNFLAEEIQTRVAHTINRSVKSKSS